MREDLSLLKRSSDSYIKGRRRTFDTYRRDYLGVKSPRTRIQQTNELVHSGDLVIDTYLHTIDFMTDVDVFEDIYTLDLDTASRLVESKNITLIGLFNRFATLKLAGGNITDAVQNGFQMLREKLEETDPIPKSLPRNSDLATSCKELRALLPRNV